MLKMLIASSIISMSFHAFAETDSFNMTLNGTFDKDYCILETTDLSYDAGIIDLDNPISTPYSPNLFYAENSKELFIRCEDQTPYEVYYGYYNGYIYYASGMYLYLELESHGDSPQKLYSRNNNGLVLTGNGNSQKITTRLMYTKSDNTKGSLGGRNITTGLPIVISVN